MKRLIGLGVIAAVALAAGAAQAEKTVRVGYCSRSITSAAAPFAIANKMGWYAEAGIKVELVALPGSTACVKHVGTGEIPYALPSVEPLAVFRPQGIKARVFYTAYQGNIYGIAVPKDSPIKTVKDLKGKTIGVTAMGSAGVIIARALAASVGYDPTKDVTIVVAGEGAQTAALVRTKQVDALSQYDTQYALVENAGVPLRVIKTAEIDRYPSNGLVALDETIEKHRAEAVAVAQGYAKGTIFAINNPEAAVRILYEVYPQTRPTGKDEATAVRDDVKVLEARAVNWKLDKAGVKRWGENSQPNFQAYLDFLHKWGILKQPQKAADVTTNDLIADINKFDPEKIATMAKAYKYKPGK